MFFKKLFGSVSDKKDASKDIEDFQKQTTPNPTTTNTTTTTTPQEPKPQEQPSTTTTTTTTTDTPDISSTPTPKRELKQVEDISLEKLFERYLKISQEEDITSDAVTVSGLIKFAEDLGTFYSAVHCCHTYLTQVLNNRCGSTRYSHVNYTV